MKRPLRIWVPGTSGTDKRPSEKGWVHGEWFLIDEDDMWILEDAQVKLLKGKCLIYRLKGVRAKYNQKYVTRVDAMGRTKRRGVYTPWWLHEMVWQSYNEPKGDKVVDFKNGDWRDCRVKNLFLRERKRCGRKVIYQDGLGELVREPGEQIEASIPVPRVTAQPLNSHPPKVTGEDVMKRLGGIFKKGDIDQDTPLVTDET